SLLGRARMKGIGYARALTAATLVVAGCGWTHAPGHDAREGMTKTAIPSLKPQLCQSGACSLAAPGGTIQVSGLAVARVNDRRNETAFEMEYLGTKAVCRGPAMGPDEAEVPFACAIDGPSMTVSRHVLVLDAGCTRGTLRE